MSQYLVIRRLSVRGANALSSSLTFGFPAVTAFMGFAHALQRHFHQATGEETLQIRGVGIVSHRFELLDHQAGYKRTLQLTANPLNEKGDRPSFVEEGRCHVTVSLVLEINGLIRGQADLTRLQQLIFAKMKLAGGDIVSQPVVEVIEDNRRGIARLMPGYALMERRDLMASDSGIDRDPLDAIHQALAIQHRSVTDEQGQVSWVSTRRQPGWIVPIATGFHALTPAQPATHARDLQTSHRFAESLVTLGEFVMASRLRSLTDLIWRYDQHDDLYRAVQTTPAFMTDDKTNLPISTQLP